MDARQLARAVLADKARANDIDTVSACSGGSVLGWAMSYSQGRAAGFLRSLHASSQCMWSQLSCTARYCYRAQIIMSNTACTPAAKVLKPLS